MNGAEYVVNFLVQKGVTHVFGYAGGYITPFMDALQQRKEITLHVCYHEQGCAFAANGYARMTGELGVFFTTSGPGAVNGLGGLADAWFDGIPLLAICGNVPTVEMLGFSDIRQHGFQEMDILSIAKTITKFAATAQSVDQLEDIVTCAYSLATTGRKGGALIDFPYNVQTTCVTGG